MSDIDLNTATPDEVLDAFPLTATGLTEIVNVITQYLALTGPEALDSAEAAADFVEGLRQAIDILEQAGIADVPGTAGEVIAAVRFVIALADAAEEAGRVVTLRAIGIVVSEVALAYIARRAAEGDEDAIEAERLARELGR